MEANGPALDLWPLATFTVHQTAASLLRPAWERTDPAAALNVTQTFPGLARLCRNSFAVVGFARYKITLPCNWVKYSLCCLVREWQTKLKLPKTASLAQDAG